MQVNSREHRPHMVNTGESVLTPRIKNRGPCPVCKKYLPQLKLGPFIKHYHQCKVDISQREVSYSSSDRDSPPQSALVPFNSIRANCQPESAFASPQG